MPVISSDLYRICPVCGERFKALRITSLFCSRKCYKKNHLAKKKQTEERERLAAKAAAVDDSRQYITVPEAVALFNISRGSLYRLIRLGRIPSLNLGERLTRINRRALEELFTLRSSEPEQPAPQKKLYSLEPEDCYTIGEVVDKYKIAPKTLYRYIRKLGIPMRQNSINVYVPKEDIDNLFKPSINADK